MAAKKKEGHSTVLLFREAIVPALVTAIVILVLYGILGILKSDFLNTLNSSLILFASFGSSAMLLFMAPHSKTAKVGKFVKSYLIATLIGTMGYLLLPYLALYIVAGAAMFVVSVSLYVTDNVHPPAVGIMLAFILFRIEFVGAMLVLSGVILLAVIRVGLEKYLYEIDYELEKSSR